MEKEIKVIDILISQYFKEELEAISELLVNELNNTIASKERKLVYQNDIEEIAKLKKEIVDLKSISSDICQNGVLNVELNKISVFPQFIYKKIEETIKDAKDNKSVKNAKDVFAYINDILNKEEQKEDE